MAAFALAFAARMLVFFAWPFLPVFSSLRFITGALTLGYVAILLCTTGTRTGKVTIGTLSAVCVTAGFAAGMPGLRFVVLCLGIIWLARSLISYRSLLSAALDAGITIASFAGAVFARVNGGGVFLVVWTFFLMQAITALVPVGFSRKKKEACEEVDLFATAHRNAETALKELLSD